VTDYRVVPEALRTMATEYVEAGDEWQQMVDAINGPEATLAEHDLGVLGELAGFVTSYNSSRTEAVNELARGRQSLADAGATLSDVAKHYEEKDFEFYRKFGYVKENLSSKSSGNQQGRNR
jgi:uncharacterized protein YukE